MMPHFRLTTTEDLNDIRIVEAKTPEEALALYMEGEGEPETEEAIKKLNLLVDKTKEDEKKSLRERAKDKLKW
jgi:hypothetical protein